MKAIHSLFILLFSVFSFGVAQAQCSGTLSLTGTDPSFTITSSNSSGPNTSYLWDLGDGSTSTTPQSVSHTYAINGIYWVTCYFTDSVNMCSDVDTIQVTVTNAVGQCDASFSITGNGPSYVFTPINTPSSPPGYYYFDWSFGDGSTSGSSSMNGVNHTYTANGTYTVTCILYDSVFCVDTATAIITVTNVSSPSCDASFSITGTDPSFTFTPINTPASPVGYYYFSWSFGDGSTSGSSSMNGVNHTYTANGTYTVTCILYDSVFCSDTVSIPVTVSGVSGSTCDASIGYIDSNGLVSFFPLSPIPGATYFWSFGDGSTSTLQNPVHQYPSTPNSYMVCLTLTDTSNNCVDSTCTLININVGPTPCDASFTYTSIGGMFTFSPLYPTSGASYNWVTSNGLSSTSQNPTFNLSSPGSYNVCLAISDSAATCIDSFCLSITVAPPVNYSIYGYITMGNSPADDGVVFLIELDSLNGTLTAVDTTIIDSMGYYQFSNVLQGIYLVKAALSPASVNYSGYLPTYYSSNSGGQLLWNNASYATSPNSMISYDISLIAGTNSGGPGFVGGLVSQGANKVGDPISDILVMVTDVNGNPVGYGYSDNTGAFYIDDLAYGDYILYPEVFGKTTTPAPFTLSAAVNDINYFRVAVNSTSVDVSMATSVKEATLLPSVSVYPNPVQDILNIDFGQQIQEPVELFIYDILGRTVSNSFAQSSSFVQVNTSTLSEGIYVLELRTATERQVFRFSK